MYAPSKLYAKRKMIYFGKFIELLRSMQLQKLQLLSKSLMAIKHYCNTLKCRSIHQWKNVKIPLSQQNYRQMRLKFLFYQWRKNTNELKHKSNKRDEFYHNLVLKKSYIHLWSRATYNLKNKKAFLNYALRKYFHKLKLHTSISKQQGKLLLEAQNKFIYKKYILSAFNLFATLKKAIISNKAINYKKAQGIIIQQLLIIISVFSKKELQRSNLKYYNV